MRCLVIEDEADTARYICNGLAESGHATSLCRNGAEGLDLATNECWDVIILDRMLPGGIDGLAIVAALRQLGTLTTRSAAELTEKPGTEAASRPKSKSDPKRRPSPI